MARIDKQYHELLEKILLEGYHYEDPNRKGTIRTEIDDYKITYDLTKGFPAITTKKLAWKSVVGELIWFLQGQTNIKYLEDNNIPIWRPDAYRSFKELYPLENIDMKEFTRRVKMGLRTKNYIYGDMGPIYGKQWRDYGANPFQQGVDQIADVVDKMRNNPMASNIVVTAWNPNDKEKMALEPCHYGFQIMMRPLTFDQRMRLAREFDLIKSVGFKAMETWSLKAVLDKSNVPKYGFTLKWRQRSVDTFLGLPFNIASYALLAHILGKITNTVPLKLVGDLSKVHIYDNAIDQAKEQITRDVYKYEDCKLDMTSTKEGRSNIISLLSDEKLDTTFRNLYIDGFKLVNYNHYPKLTAKMLSYNK